MKQISKTDFARLRDYATVLDNIRDEIDAVVNEANEKIAAIMENLNDYIDEGNGFVSDLASEAESYYDERSDNWRDGDNGQMYYDWLSEIQNCANELESRNFALDASEITSEIESICETINNVRQSPDE